MEFDWDPVKAVENLRKYKVSFGEAITVFGDFLGATALDPDTLPEEQPFIEARKANERKQ